MINNRQGGRRRGRGGQRPAGMPNRPDGNRQDNRQRGNAAQLLEKYKAMARDSQLAGDRVQTEYYLQFADHYFRVLEEGRSRFEEQNQRRRRDEDDEDGDDDEQGSTDNDGDMDDDGDEDNRPAPRRDRNRSDSPRADRDERAQRDDRPERNQRDERGSRDERPARAMRDERAPRAERSERTERPRRERAVADEGAERIALGVLPPAIGVSAEVEVAQDAPRPRRRARKIADDAGPEDVAPAA